jgi:hypothetical protein
MPGTSGQLHTATEIIVESAALYSISALVYTPMLTNIEASVTYGLYADIFFAYMAVESHHPSFFVLIA